MYQAIPGLGDRTMNQTGKALAIKELHSSGRKGMESNPVGSHCKSMCKRRKAKSKHSH